MELINALKSLVSKPVPEPTEMELVKYTDSVLALRTDPELRHFLEVRASDLQMNSASDLCVALLRAFKEEDDCLQIERSSAHLKETKTAANRVREVFDRHGYGVLEAIEILKKYDVSVADYFDDFRLIDRLIKQGFTDLSDVFAVSRDWLTSKSDNVRKAGNLDDSSRKVMTQLIALRAENRLEKFSPICRSKYANGRELLYQSGQGAGHVDIGIVLILKAPEGYKHNSMRTFGPISFDHDRTRIQSKALLLAARKHSRPGEFQGYHLSDKHWDDIFGTNLVTANDIQRGGNFWDAEGYVDERANGTSALDSHEYGQVKAKAEELFGNVLTTGQSEMTTA